MPTYKIVQCPGVKRSSGLDTSLVYSLIVAVELTVFITIPLTTSQCLLDVQTLYGEGEPQLTSVRP